MNINTEISEAISRNLPQAVGEELQKRLAKADKDAAELVTANATIAANRDTVQRLNNLLAAAQDELKAHEALSRREAAVAKREQEAELQATKVALASATENAKFARDVAMGLVRNAEYRHSVYESSTNRAIGVPQGGMVLHAYNPENKTTDTTQEQK